MERRRWGPSGAVGHSPARRSRSPSPCLPAGGSGLRLLQPLPSSLPLPPPLGPAPSSIESRGACALSGRRLQTPREPGLRSLRPASPQGASAELLIALLLQKDTAAQPHT